MVDSVTISCDNNGALSRPHSSPRKVITSSTYYDLLYEIKRLQHLLPFTISTQEIAPHLDLQSRPTLLYHKLLDIQVDPLVCANTTHAVLVDTSNTPAVSPPSHY